MNEFYLTLPSNTNQAGNIPQKFTVRLPYKMRLEGNWEVGLAEIMYPYTWKNVDGWPLRSIKDKLPVTSEPEPYGNTMSMYFVPGKVWFEVIVPPGYYATPLEFLKAIQKGVHRVGRMIDIRAPKRRDKRDVPKQPKNVAPSAPTLIERALKFSYDSVLHRMKISFNKDIIGGIVIPSRLQYMMGLTDRVNASIRITEEYTVAKYPVDLHAGFYALYVYCSLVENQIVGNALVPLLRMVHIEGQHGETTDQIFQNPHYVPLVTREFDCIEINIKDDTNQFVPFEYGKIVVKLHFRKHRPVLW